MGIFSFIKSIKEEVKKRNNFVSMSIEELKELSDEDLREALSERLLIEEEHNGWMVKDCLHAFQGAKRVFYIVNYFDMEVQNGGLCQFFVNSSRDVAPYLLDCLQEIQAYRYYKLLADFIQINNLNFEELTSFIIDDIDEYEEQCERYPFDDFDDQYYELYEQEALEDLLIVYAKKHLEDFK